MCEIWNCVARVIHVDHLISDIVILCRRRRVRLMRVDKGRHRQPELRDQYLRQARDEGISFLESHTRAGSIRYDIADRSHANSEQPHSRDKGISLMESHTHAGSIRYGMADRSQTANSGQSHSHSVNSRETPRSNRSRLRDQTSLMYGAGHGLQTSAASTTMTNAPSGHIATDEPRSQLHNVFGRYFRPHDGLLQN